MTSIIKEEQLFFEKIFEENLTSDIGIYLHDFLMKKSKRLRPLLGILYIKALKYDLTEEVKNLFIGVELVHNASIIHDDVIDNAVKRRGDKSLNNEFDNSLSVVSGDLLLAIAMQKIIALNDYEVQKLCSECMINTCRGEISQYFSKYKMPSIEEYIEKTTQKTAYLFKFSILGAVMLLKKIEYYKFAEEFAMNFGIAFQLINDLKNYQESQNDYNQGIYTAPIIYGKENGVEKTQDLINNYLGKARESLNCLPKGKYKEAIIDIVEKI
jgi:geranylgeranyl pyrophosphate synthase